MRNITRSYAMQDELKTVSKMERAHYDKELRSDAVNRLLFNLETLKFKLMLSTAINLAGVWAIIILTYNHIH